MTQKQLDILVEIARTSREILEVHFLGGIMEITFLDRGGNLFNRRYNSDGKFAELVV